MNNFNPAIWHRFGQELQPYGIILVSNGIFLRSDFKTAEEAERKQFSPNWICNAFTFK